MNIQRIVSALENRFFRYINERRGWKTDRKIVVIESDDWGSIRMPNRETYEYLLEKGIRVDKSTYNKYDSLATADDLSFLFDVLKNHKDKNGNHPVITANTCVSNPDFKKIKDNNYSRYFYEPFNKTLERERPGAYKLWHEGIDSNIFYPQLHNREHLNVNKWLSYLRKGNSEVLLAFELGLWGIGPLISQIGNPSFVRAFDDQNYSKYEPLSKIIGEGCNIFESLFGFKSKSFIAPNYIWDDKVECYLSEHNIKYLQGIFTRRMPDNCRRHHYLGQKNKHNQTYLIRNVQFEPAANSSKETLNKALSQIEKAFHLNKPAIICTHRVSFIGAIFEDNRTRNLELFNELLSSIIKKWPNVEFLRSDELGDLINK